MRDAVAGSGSASAVLTGTKLTITGTFEGLRSPATAARVHSGAARGVRGASVAELTVSKATNGHRLTGSLDLTREQVQSLQSGRLYLQISSEKAPDGNLWGWFSIGRVRARDVEEAQRYARPARNQPVLVLIALALRRPHAGRSAGGPRRVAIPRHRRPPVARHTRRSVRAATSRISKARAMRRQLAGSEFIDAWGRRSTRELLSFMQLTMPPARPGALSQEEYANVAAFILQSNGAAAGNQPLTATTEVDDQHHRDRSGSGSCAAQAQARRRPPAPAAGGGRGRGAAAPPVGITVAGEVKNYVPVTDAMLRNPDPADWLMIRHDYHANNYSPLNQITADNVKDLRLQWVWAMNEGGANQPAPLVHNGVVYLNNPGNVMQAHRRQDRRSDLGESLRHARDRRRHARHLHLRRQRLRRRRAMRGCGLRRARPARPSGRPPSAIDRRATTAPAAARCWPRAS